MTGKSSKPRRPAASQKRPRRRGIRPNPPDGPCSAREIVARRLTEEARHYPEFSLLPLETRLLDDRDAALAHAIYDAVVRRWITLEFLLDSSLKTPLRLIEPALQAVLLSGAAQLLFLDRVPPHAAINESVELAKRLVRPGAGPITNAVLRKMAALRAGAVTADTPTDARDTLPLPDGRRLALSKPVLPADEAEGLAAATSHPTWLIRRWRAEFGDERAAALAHHNLVSPPTILNAAYAAALPRSLEPHADPNHRLFSGSRAQLVKLLDSHADLWVQDPASSRAIASVGNLQPALIIDVCAGQGTKTRQLAAAFPSASIVASDTDPNRFRTLISVFHSHSRVRVVPAQDLLSCFPTAADLILLDVPCSNTGVLARRPEARYRCSDAQLERLAGIQRQILADAIPLLKPGGRILYSTCSVEREENEAIVRWACRWHPFRVEQECVTLPASLPGQSAGSYHDGSYSALLAAPGGGHGYTPAPSTALRDR